MQLLKQRYWHELFEVGVFFKALNSVWETLGGVFLLLTIRRPFAQVFVFLSTSNLLGDRDDLLFSTIRMQLVHLSLSTRAFVGIYLLFHGLMNMFLAYNLYRNRLWAYPLSIAFTSLFFIYQLYRLAHTHSLILLAVSVFDILFIIFTYHEYRYQKHKHVATSTS
ncbi:MAG: DUF2127 domain-containing protein [Patescibacteria group bacterium]|nr:DUF2127 domain-containing protein [Patescibacteria group bacterium]